MGIFGFGNKQDSTGNYMVPVDNDSLFKRIMNFLRGKRNNKPKRDDLKQFFVDGKVIMLDTHTYQEADGNIIQLKVARIFGNQQLNRFVPEKYLIFGLGENQNIDNDFLQKVVDTYHIQGDNGTISQYLGRYNENQNMFANSNESELLCVYDDLIPYVNASHKQTYEIKVENSTTKSSEEEFRKKYEVLFENIDRKKGERQREIASRLNSPFLTYKDESDNNIDGINLENGDILKIRRLNKIGKDENNMYLYTCYIQSVFDPGHYEVLPGSPEAEPCGKYICFATKRKMEDIIEAKNQTEITRMLQLLSGDSSNYYPNNKLNYIGSINEEGIISKYPDAVSQTIRNTVSDLQKQYESFKQNENRGYRN